MSSTMPKRYHAFLSYNSQDRPAVEELAGRLRRERLELYLEVWEILPGRVFQPNLAQGLGDSKTCVVFLGPSGLGPWQKEELQVAIDQRVRDADFHVIPVLLPGAERPRRGDVALLEFLINASWVEFLKTLDDERAFQSLVCGITGTKPSPPDVTQYEGICPYRGLEPFRADDAKFFFGRDRLTGWLVSALRREVRAAQGVRFLGVLGPSGSGKSSVVLAGLIPTLQAGAIEGSERWPVAILRTGDDPLKNLAAAVVSRFMPAGALPDVGQIFKLAEGLRSDSRALDVFAQAALHDQPEDVRLVVVVDQFEEVFTYRCQDDQARARFEEDRAAFFATILHAAAAPRGRVAVVLSLRSDFLSACAAFPQLAAVLSAHQELVGPMTDLELREAIERPAYLVGCEVDSGLTERLLADVEGRPGALPLLQFALTEVWKKRDVRRLTLRAYNELGGDQGEKKGIEGALEHRAEEIYRGLQPRDQDLCRRLFLRLVQPGEGPEDTKRRVSFRELLPHDPAKAEAVRKLIQILADRDARLVVTTEGTGDRDGAVEVAHEALIRSWTRLRHWIDAEREGLRIHRQLTEAAREWQANRREGSFLYGGSRLMVARAWAKTHRDEINDLEEGFLAASLGRQRRRKIAMAASILVVLAGGLGGVEYYRWNRWIQFQRLSNVVDNDVEEARKLSLEARWPEAIKVLEGTESRLGPAAEYESLRNRVASDLASYQSKQTERQRQEDEQKALDRDRKTVAALDEARLLKSGTPKEGVVVDWESTFAAYRRVFREAGIDIDTLTPEKAAELLHVKIPDIREALSAVLDDWAWRAGPPRDTYLRKIARDADPDPLRNAIRDAVAKGDVPALKKRATDPDVLRLPAVTLDLLGSELSKAQEFGAAITLLRQAQRRYRQDFWINYSLGFAFTKATPAQFEEAVRYYTAAVALRPESYGANLHLGLALTESGRYDEAFYCCTKAINIDSNNAMAYGNRGYAHLKRNELALAVADFDTAIRLDPKNAMAYVFRGVAHATGNDFGKALLDYDEAIRLDPKNVDGYEYRGQVHAAMREPDKAVADFDAAIRLDPKYVQAYIDRANVFSARNEYTRALADLDTAVRIAPKNVWTYANRGAAHAAAKKHDKALADFNTAIRLAPQFVQVYIDRANAHAARRDYQKALADCDQAARLAPNFFAPYNLRAWIHATCPEERYRDGKKALESATRACELTGWKNPLVLDTLAAACAEGGDFEAAVKWEEKATGLLVKEDETNRRDFGARLGLYQAKKPYRTEAEAASSSNKPKD